MVAKHYYRNFAGTLVHQDRVDRMGWALKEAAEEGATPLVTITVDDPLSELDFVGHRRWLVIEDTSEADDDVLYSGYTGSQTISHKEGEHHNPLDRVWSIELVDVNTLWQRKVMTGSDCDRDAETDVERMQWLLQTNEADLWFENVTDYVATGSPVAMDAVDYRGQMFGQIADDCAQASGKNWFARYMRNLDTLDRELTAFYGAYTWNSPLSLSNDPDDLDRAMISAGTATTYEIAANTQLNRSAERVYSHVYLPYDGGAVYRAKPSTVTAFALGGRDFVAPSLNVKSKAKANARALRYLNDLDSQDERITTAAVVPASKGTMLRPGMMISFRATHLPGYETARNVRILNATPTPVNGGNWYNVQLELQGPGSPGAYSCSAAIAARVTDTAIGLEASMPAAVSVTAPDDGYVVGIVLADNGNTPDATGMGTPSGYTNLDARDFSRATWFMGYKAAAAGSVGISASWTPGFASSGVWAAGLAWLPWSGVTVVQEAEAIGGAGGDMTFPAPVTPGNTILMFATSQDLTAITFTLGGISGPTTGWAELFSRSTVVSSVNSRAHIACWARCVESGDGEDYGWSYAGMVPLQAFGYAVEIQTS